MNRKDYMFPPQPSAAPPVNGWSQGIRKIRQGTNDETRTTFRTTLQRANTQ